MASTARGRSETARIAKPIWGDQLYQVRARAALPLLVLLAQARETVYYKKLAQKMGIPNHRHLNYVLGSVGQSLKQLSATWGEEIPPIQCLVFNKDTGLPGEGIGWFLIDKVEFKTLSLAQQQEIVRARLPQIYDYPRWPEVLRALSLAPQSEIATDIENIIQQGKDETTVKSLVEARLGQGAFRARVLYSWDDRCAVSGATTQVAIRASHIKPWRSSTNAERLDPYNGLPLVASLDALFDAGLISFDDAGTILVSPRLRKSEQSIFSLAGKSLLKKPSKETAKYLAHHRAKIFKR